MNGTWRRAAKKWILDLRGDEGLNPRRRGKVNTYLLGTSTLKNGRPLGLRAKTASQNAEG